MGEGSAPPGGTDVQVVTGWCRKAGFTFPRTFSKSLWGWGGSFKREEIYVYLWLIHVEI